jgi:hypothetical protein
MWAESHMSCAGFLRNRNGPTNVIFEFSSYLRTVCFIGVFAPLTKSKKYEIWRVGRGLLDERFGF